MLNSKRKQEKAQIQEELRQKLSQAKSVILVDFRGLTVADDTRLRKACRENKVEYKVVKNTLAQRAMSQLGWEGYSEILQGPTAIAFSTTDPVAPAKVLTGFIREVPVIRIKGGYLDGVKLSPDRIEFLATLPSREELLARVAGGLKAPVASLVTVLNATLSGFARAVEALRQKRAGAGA